MKKQTVRFLALLLAVLMVLSGCTAAPADGTTQPADATAEKEVNQTDAIPEETTASQDEKEELWVVYDHPMKFIHKDIINKLLQTFSETYPDVAVRVESVPEEEAALQQLRAQIMAGKGPDVYIVAKGTTLFTDPYLDMANGLFEDVGQYYDTDEELKKKN